MVRGLGYASLVIGVAMACWTQGAADAFGRERLAGPFRAVVTRVLDGDTIDVRVRVWLGQVLQVRVRIAGIDAPQLHGRCATVRWMARLSRDALVSLVAGSTVTLVNVRSGKFYGRVIADVIDRNGLDLSSQMLRQGMAWPYRERRHRRARACAKLAAGGHGVPLSVAN